MRVSSLSFTDQFLPQINDLQARQNQLQAQASSQLKVSQAEDDPHAVADVLNLQAQNASNSQYLENISSLLNAANHSYTAVKGIQTLTASAGEIASKATSGTASSSDLSNYASEIGKIIDQALQAANTRDANGNYIFAGTKTTQPPFVGTKDAAGNYTSITYQGNTSVAQVDIADNYSVSAQVPGANTTGSGATGLFTDSRSGTDVFAHLISLQQHLLAGNTAAISSTDIPAVNADGNHVISLVSANGVLQSALNSAQDLANSKKLNIDSDISGKTSADLATTLTQLTRTQSAYQAALSSGTKVFNLSLLDYLK